jgi:hypothetical protein
VHVLARPSGPDAGKHGALDAPGSRELSAAQRARALHGSRAAHSAAAECGHPAAERAAAERRHSAAQRAAAIPAALTRRVSFR